MKLLVFDLDGTLLDSKNSILRSIDHALSKVGLEHFEIDRKRAVQQDLISTIKQSAALGGYGISEDLIRAFVHEYRLHHSHEPEKHISPYPEMREVLEELSGTFTMAVATTKNSEQAEHILSQLKMANFFDHIQGTDPGMRYKPAPDILFAVLAKLGYEASEALYVGDSHHDIEAAKAAGLKSLAATYGFGTREELFRAQPDYWLHKPADIRDPLRFFENSAPEVNLSQETGRSTFFDLTN